MGVGKHTVDDTQRSLLGGLGAGLVLGVVAWLLSTLTSLPLIWRVVIPLAVAIVGGFLLALGMRQRRETVQMNERPRSAFLRIGGKVTGLTVDGNYAEVDDFMVVDEDAELEDASFEDNTHLAPRDAPDPQAPEEGEDHPEE